MCVGLLLGYRELARDYDFKNLILSTAEAPDVTAIKEVTTRARVFQYD